VIAILASTVLALAASFSPQDASTSSQQAVTMHGTESFEQLAQNAKRAREENRDDEAIQIYQQTLKIKPEWDEGLWYLGTLQYEKGNYFEACETLRRFVAEDPGVGYGWTMLGMSEFQTREYTRALDHLQQGTTLGLGDNRTMATTAIFLTAMLLTRSEQFDDSMNLLFSLMANGKATASLVDPLGLAALRLPFLPSEIPPARQKIVRVAGAAAIALEAQRYGEAEKLFSELETAYPGQPGVHFLVGAYLLGVRPDDGIKEMKREIEISPSHVPARIRLAEEYIKRQDLNQGISFAQEALKLAPKDGLAHMVLGEGLTAKGDAAGGIRELEAARDSLPDEVRIRWDLVRAYTAAGRTEDASREKGEIERLSKQNATH
jgi:tetratricopeptide (TPR) repeat protein